jgi:two-component SAPR family response regulator
MDIEHITQLNNEDFGQTISGRKTVLIYPLTPHKTAFLSQFIQLYGDRLVYHSMSPAPTLTAALQFMVDDQGDILARLRTALKKKTSTPKDLAVAFAKDLEGVSEKAVALYLDNVDFITNTENFTVFLEEFVAALPQNVQLVVSARQMTTQPWNQLLEQGNAVVLGMGYREDETAFRPDASERPLLEIFAFGRGHALVNGTPIEHWDGALPRSLFFFFADHDLASRDQIFSVFWPDLPVKEATNVFHVTKRKISERITTHVRQEDGNYELTNYANGFYHPSESVQRHYDVTDFEEAIQQATNTPDEEEQERFYRRALDIYKAPFLAGLEMPWVQERRETLRLMYVDALISISRLQKRKNHHAEALGFFLRALKEIPQREDIHREAMSLYWQLGEPQNALNQYRLLEEYLQRTVGVRPSRETRELHERIQSEGQPS